MQYILHHWIIFLPTPSARRATCNRVLIVVQRMISTHALREEGDYNAPGHQYAFDLFLPTPSARRATRLSYASRLGRLVISTHALREEGDPGASAADLLPLPISTHALREEGDGVNHALQSPLLHFYPRPPRGGRQQMCHKTKAIFWQHLYNEIQLTKKAGCICAGCTVCEAQPARLSKTDRCEAAGDFLSAVPSHQSSAFGDSIP